MAENIRFDITAHDNTGRAFQAVNGNLGKLGGSAVAVTRQLDALKVAALGFAGGLAGALVAGALTQIPGAIRGIVAEGAGLVDTASKLGITTTALQELHFAATQGGASIEDFDRGLGYFVKQLGEASRGSGDLGKVLEANGIALRDQDGAMRPVADLLRSYADLVARAGSEQERATLSAIAFGRGGADMANVFRDGAAGIGAAADELHRLGGVMDEQTLKDIAAIDDRFDALSTTISVKLKGAVLETVAAFDNLFDHMRAANEQNDLHLRYQLQDVYAQRDVVKAQVDELKADLADPFRSSMLGHTKLQLDLSDAEKQLEALTQKALGIRDVLDSRSGWVPPSSGDVALSGEPAPDVPLPRSRPVVLPSSGAGGARNGARGGKSSAYAVDRAGDVVKSLADEYTALGMTNREREVYNNLLRAGVDAQSEAGVLIANYTGAIYDQTQAIAALNEQSDFFAGTLYGAFDDLIIQGQSVEDVIANLGKSLAQAALQAALLGQGPLAGLLGMGGGGGAGGGLLGSLLGAVFGGFRASGGEVSPGKLYAVNERTAKTEFFMPSTPGSIVTHEDVAAGLATNGGRGRGGNGGVSNNYAVTVDLRGTTGEAALDAKIRAATEYGFRNAVQVSQANVMPTIAKSRAESGGDWRL